MTAGAILARIDRRAGPEACWPWQGYRDWHGYGRIEAGSRAQRRTRAAHVVVWELMRGPVPAGLELDHRCNAPACVNPAHLEPVTHRENMLRGPRNWAARNARRTHCPQGHLIDGMRRDGRRYCRPCSVENVRRWRQRQ